jgi:hypothetical protein
VWGVSLFLCGFIMYFVKTENFEAGFLVIVASAIIGSCALLPLALTGKPRRDPVAAVAATQSP